MPKASLEYTQISDPESRPTNTHHNYKSKTYISNTQRIFFLILKRERERERTHAMEED